MPVRWFVLHRLVTSWAFALALSAAAIASAQPPTSYPLGHHVNNFVQRSATVSSSGWDPAYDNAKPQDQTDKLGLISEFNSRFTTYSVGLPGSTEPGNISKTWTLGSSVTPSELAANFPKISLSGVSGDVYLIDGYTNCSGNAPDGCPSLEFTGGASKVVIARSAFGSIKATSSSASGMRIWILDSLIDAQTGQTAGLHCLQCAEEVVMYSEVLGGGDGAKLRGGHTIYRSHIHGIARPGAGGGGGGSPDGIQCEGGCEGAYIIESNIDFLWKNDNAGIWLSTNVGDAGPVYHYGNVIQGGHSATRVVTKTSSPPDGVWVGNAVYKNNLYFANSSKASFSSGAHVDAGSVKVPEHATGNQRLNGVAVSFGDGAVTATEDAAVSAQIDKVEGWVEEIRAAAGYSGGSAPGASEPPEVGLLPLNPPVWSD